MVKEKRFDKEGIESLAIFSDDEKYRFVLRRVWDDKKGRTVFIGLNPSTADEIKNDPTVSRMISLSKSWGFGSVSVCNLFAFRATFPSDLKKAENPIGDENDSFILKEMQDADKVIACWGNHGKFLNRSENFSKNLKNFEHFGFTKAGEPHHLLYLRKDAPLFEG
ncbi:MAG: DUF1643 domain-containing protein [Candidatus Nanoarchaeia archaeon]|nr:DUF1643 domain-containing protein [Candidatus Nanoarchaeia archaeon]